MRTIEASQDSSLINSLWANITANGASNLRCTFHTLLLFSSSIKDRV